MAMTFDTPSSACRPTSMSSNSSSDNNPFFDDMAYLEQVVQEPKKSATKSKMKWGGRNKLKSESASKSSETGKALAASAKASVQQLASPPASLYPVSSNVTQSTTSNSTLRRTPSVARSAYSSVSTAPPPVVSLSSESESDGPGNFFDDISRLDTATSIRDSQPKKKNKEKSKGKDKDRSKNGPMGKLRLLKSTTSLSSSKVSSDTASTMTARQSTASSDSSFTFTRSRTRSSSFRYSRSTVTSLATVTTSAHTSTSDPSPASRVQSPSNRSSPASMKQSLPFPAIESLAPQLPPINFRNSIASSSSAAGHTPHTPSPSTSSGAPSVTTSSPRWQPASLHPAPSQALQPVLTAQRVSASPRGSPAPPLAPSPRSNPIALPGTAPRGSSASMAAAPGSQASNLVPSPFSSSPQAISSHLPVPTPIHNTERQRSASSGAVARRMSNGWQQPHAPTMSPRRQSLRATQARKGSASSEGRKSSLGSNSNALNARRMSRMSRMSGIESPCLSIIGHFPEPPEMELGGNRQLGPGSSDDLVNSLAAVAEAASRGNIYEWRVGLNQDPPRRGSSVSETGQQREPSAAFSDEYMPFLTTPSRPNSDAQHMQVGDYSGSTQDASLRQAAQARGKEQSDHEDPREGTTASPILLTPDAVVSSGGSLKGLAVPWAVKAGKRRSSSSSLTADREAARPESVMLPDSDDASSSTQPSPSRSPALNRSNDYVSESIDPLARPPASPSTLSAVSSYSTASVLSQESYPPPPPPPPQTSTTSGVDPDHAARRRTFGEPPSLPGMPIAYERNPARPRMGSASTVASSTGRFAHRQDSGASSYSAYSALSSGLGPRTKRQDSAASAFSIGANMSPTNGAFQTTEVAPLRIHRERSGSGAQRTRGPTAPLNIAPARQRTFSGASSDSSYAMPSHYSSLSSSYDSGSGPRFMAASAEGLPNARFNMSGHDVTRLRTISSGDGSKARPVPKQAPTSALPAPPGRRPSTGGSPHMASPPSPLTQHTAKGHAPSSFVPPPPPSANPAHSSAPGTSSVPRNAPSSRGPTQNGGNNQRRARGSGSQTGGRPTISQIHQTQVSASIGASFIAMPPKSPTGAAVASRRGSVSPRRTPIAPPRSLDVVEHPSHSNSYNHWAPSSPRSRGTPF